MADFTGTTGDDHQDGTSADETFDYSQGGEDFVRGLDGSDIFLMGAALDAGDSIHGGAGNDEVVLDGDYNLSFAAETIVNVETLRLSAGHDYTMDTAEANILAGKTLTIDASALGAGDVLIFHGFSETDGMFSITAGAGADTIVGGDKADFIDGGAGDDLLGGGKGNDRLSGHEGMDNIFGGAGDDSVGGGDADDNLYGGDDNDTITDTKGNNHLYGEAGDDTLTGGIGNDTLDGGTGTDTMSGGGGDDTIITATDADKVFGGDGNDAITFGFTSTEVTAATAVGGAGNDTINFLASSTAKSVSVDSGDDDDVVAIGGATIAALNGGAGADELTLTGTIVFALATFDGSSGFESVVVSGAHASTTAAAAHFDFSAAVNTTTFTLAGGAGADTLIGTSGTDFISGGSGDDVVFGGDGNDSLNGSRLYGGVGDDHMVAAGAAYGGKGDDFFDFPLGTKAFGGAGEDTVRLSGIPVAVKLGSGNDLLTTFTASEATLHADVLQGGRGLDTMSLGGSGTLHLDMTEFSAASTGFEKLVLNSGVPTALVGNGANNHLDLDSLDYDGGFRVHGGDGDDIIDATLDQAATFGDAGDDMLNGGTGAAFGGDGNDTISALDRISGDAGNDVLMALTNDGAVDGGDGDDTIYGGQKITGGTGDDVIYGGKSITGGAGSDSMTAMGGANQYLLFSVSDLTGPLRDVITNFDAQADRIHIHSHPNAVLDTPVGSGFLSNSSFDHDLMVAVDLTKLASNHALLFTPNAGDQAGKTFLIVDDNGQAGYQAGVDYVIEFDDATNMDQFTL